MARYAISHFGVLYGVYSAAGPAFQGEAHANGPISSGFSSATVACSISSEACMTPRTAASGEASGTRRPADDLLPSQVFLCARHYREYQFMNDLRGSEQTPWKVW